MLLLIVTFLIVCFFVGVGMYVYLSCGDMGVILFTFLIGIFFSVPLMIISGVSYSNYIEMKSIYEGVVSQYKDSIDMYENKAVVYISGDSFTDFKYKGYQENIANLIKDLRQQITTYNKVFIKKNILADNIIWGTLIFEPDKDMKLLHIKEK